MTAEKTAELDAIVQKRTAEIERLTAQIERLTVQKSDLQNDVRTIKTEQKASNLPNRTPIWTPLTPVACPKKNKPSPILNFGRQSKRQFNRNRRRNRTVEKHGRQLHFRTFGQWTVAQKRTRLGSDRRLKASAQTTSRRTS
jgi:hypothetical protein